MPEYIRKNLGQRLIDAGLITSEQYEQAMQKHAETQMVLRRVLVEMGFIDEDRLLEFTSTVFGVQVVRDLVHKIKDREVLRLIPEKVCRKYTAVPLFKVDQSLTVAMADPLDVFAIDDLENLTRCRIEAVQGRQDEILAAIDRFYEGKGALDEIVQGMEADEQNFEIIREARDEAASEDLAEVAEAPIIKLVNTMINQAIKERASDIHVEPDEKGLRIRYRVDGILKESMSPPKKLQAAITSRVKIMAGMDISVKLSPQDGRFRIRADNKDFDVRISTVPTIYGEKVVMRLLDQSSIRMGLGDAGFSPECLQLFNEMIERPYGIILVTGPTGSGKTTTLYLALQTINSPDKNIITIEEPVEYDLEGINQIAVNVKANVTFANGLRSILRQDPDVIMVGEMRDLETADVAVRAALTGHLVFSTLHTNDAASSVARMIDMGVAPYLVTSAVSCVLAQRLVRTICSHCREAYHPPAEIVREAGLPEAPETYTFYRGRGCDECGKTGFRGRTGIFELMVVDRNLRALIQARKSTDQIREAAQKNGMKTLWEDGLDKVLRGVTTIKELRRVTFMEET